MTPLRYLRTYIDALPHLYGQYWKEMFVNNIAWGTFGVLASIGAQWLLIWLGG